MNVEHKLITSFPLYHSTRTHTTTNSLFHSHGCWKMSLFKRKFKRPKSDGESTASPGESTVSPSLPKVVIPFKTSDEVPKEAFKSSLSIPPKPLVGETPIQYVERVIGDFYTMPLVSCLAGWSESLAPQVRNPFPRNGSFDPYHLGLADRLINQGMGDPVWDYAYMKQAFVGWKTLKSAWDRGHEKCNTEGIACGLQNNARRTIGEDNDDLTAVTRFAHLYPDLGSLTVLRGSGSSSLSSSCLTQEKRKTLQDKIIQDLSQLRGKVDKTDRLADLFSTQTPSSDVLIDLALLDSERSDLHARVKAIYSEVELLQLELPDFASIKPGVEMLAQQFPFLRINDNYVLKPLDFTQMNQICKDAPRPEKNVNAFMSYTRRLAKFHNLTGADWCYYLEYMFENTQASGWDKDDDMIDWRTAGRIDQGKYKWADDIEKFLKDLDDYCKKIFKDKIDFTKALSVKQASGEAVSAFLERYEKAWKEEAKLPLTSPADEWSFVSSAMANMLPACSSAMKMFVDFTQSL